MAAVMKPRDPDITYSQVGTRPNRPDGVDKVTGRARYGADVSAPGMLIGKVLRSPHAHARIRSIDASRAMARNPGPTRGHIVPAWTSCPKAAERKCSLTSPAT